VKGYAAIPVALRACNIPVVFGMLGGTNVAWIAEGVRTRAFRLVKTRHEETAVVAAAAYAVASGQVGVCTVTRGPGFANSINGLLACAATHAPVVLIVGESRSKEPDAALNIDQEKVCELMDVGFLRADRASDLQPTIAAAVARARWDGTPQVVSTADESLHGQTSEVVARADPAGTTPPLSRETLSAVVDLLAGATRPLIIAGRGAVLADCRDELTDLADTLGAQTATTLLANCFFAEHPRNLGLSGGWGAPLAYTSMSDADVVFAVGASMNEFTRDFGGLYADAKVIRCDVNGAGNHGQVAIELVGDANTAIRVVREELSRRTINNPGRRRRGPSQEDIRDSVRSVDLGHSPERGIDLRAAYAIFDRKLPADRIVTTDSGRSLATCPLLVGAKDAQSWLVGRGYGTIGHGVGTAIGAAIACPERPVVLFSGDGGFMLASHDLDTVRLSGIDNLTIVIMNDEMYGSEMRHLTKHALPMDVIGQPIPDVRALAHAYGGDGATVTDEAQLESLVIPDTGLFMVDVRLDPLVDGRDALAGHLRRRGQ
jgi:acetolactate synthase I/II/III large subunit